MRLSVKNGTFSYKKNDRVILNNINFSTREGEIMAILGPNGAGKTTLLRCVMGFLKWNSGASMLDETDIRSIPVRELWKNVAYVPQAKQASSAYSVEETIMLGRGSHFGLLAQPSAKDIEKVTEAMHRLYISHLAKKRCSEISGGELQMVLIARALVSEPQILILDEPESNLDFRNQLLVLNTMSELATEGISCIFNTHFPSHALQRASKSLLFCGNGETIFGDTTEIVTEANIEKAFGVKAIIGKIETEETILQDVVPVELSEQPIDDNKKEDASNRLAVVAIITSNYDSGEKINQLIHEHSGCIVGRMGMPYPQNGVYIINVILDGPEKDIQTLSHKLSILPGVSVKTTFAQKASSEQGGALTFDQII